MTDSFWKIPEKANIKTPRMYLQEQAAALTEGTGGVLIGDISVSPGGQNGTITNLIIRIPSLNNYVFDVVAWYQNVIIMYPGTFTDYTLQTGFNIADEQTLASILKDTLGSDRVQNILMSMLAQAGAS